VAGELAGLERVCAGEQLAAVRSWRWMLRASGGDAEIGELVLEFARELL
jgi:hypothetical protein